MKNSNKQVKNLWVKFRGQANKRNFTVGIYYRSPDQGEPVDKELLLQEASCSQALIKLRDFNHPDIC